MRSDSKLSSSIRQSEAWVNNPLTERKDAEVDRFSLPDKERVRLSLSGKERNHLFLNEGGKSFKDVSGISGADSIKDGRSFALLDFDRDGWQDIFLVNTNAPVMQLYRNQTGSLQSEQTKQGSFVALRFVGGNRTAKASQELSNRDGYGVRYKVILSDKTLVGEYSCGEGLAAQNSRTKLVGIGQADSVSAIEILWPSGKAQRIEGVSAGELITFFEDATEVEDQSGVRRVPYLLNEKIPLTIPGKTREFEGRQFRPDIRSQSQLVVYTSMATWCESCRGHVPALVLLRNKFPEATLRMIGVPIDESDRAEVLASFVEETKVAYELDQNWNSEQRYEFKKIARDYLGLDALPTTIITRANGEVVDVISGIPTVSDIARLLQE